jgi:hypothetical protein
MSLGRYRSQIPEADWDNIRAWARDDVTGLPVMHDQLVKQMQYGPQGLYWTGWMVHKDDYDEPNPQLVPPRLRPDPVPVRNPRIFSRQELPTIPTGLVVSAPTTENSITVSWDLVIDTPVPVNSYIVQCTSQFAAFTSVPLDGPPYTIMGLAGGIPYLVQVASTNNVTGTSALSTPIAVTTLS